MASTEVRRRKPDLRDDDDKSAALAEATASASSETEEISSDEAKKLAAPKGDKKKKRSKTAKLDEEDEYDNWNIALDVFRVVTFLFLASCGLSYLISGGETFFWGMSDPPKYLKADWWKAQLKGPLYLTPAELSLYDGSDPTKPIYLAINWTIYDVSSNPRTYGPGGSYHYFAGCDAARAYVTGCFAEDRTPDMRGVEDMYLPLDDPEVDRHFSRAELTELKTKEREEAAQKVHDGLLHWVNFFHNSPKYNKVGYVKKPKGWPGTEPMRPLCESAAKQRKARKIPAKEDKSE